MRLSQLSMHTPNICKNQSIIICKINCARVFAGSYTTEPNSCGLQNSIMGDVL